MDEIKVSVRVPLATLVAGLTLSSVATAGVIYFRSSSTSADAFATFGLGVGVTTLIYAALQFQLSNRIRLEELRINKLDKALDFMATISEPAMASILRTTAELGKELSKSPNASPTQLVESDDSRHSAAVTSLNYLERLAIIVRYDAADERILRDFYCVPVRRTWHNFQPWIKLKRQEWQTEDLFTELEWLAARWKKGS